MTSPANGTTLRLHLPQWQGGNRPEYHFGAQLLAWLAPPADGPVETVPVSLPQRGERLTLDDGVLAAMPSPRRPARRAKRSTGTGPTASSRPAATASSIWRRWRSGRTGDR